MAAATPIDRARLRAGRYWAAGNLKRLRRSLDKLISRAPDTGFDEADWSALLAGYQDAV